MSRQRVCQRISSRIINFHSQYFTSQSIIRAIIPIMNPFIHLPDFNIIVCTGQKCKYAILPIHMDSHLSSPRHNYNKEQREQAIQEISQIEGLIQDTRGLESFTFPEPTSPAIPELMVAKANGLKCQSYRYMICHRQLI
jgi:hypothetical protein